MSRFVGWPTPFGDFETQHERNRQLPLAYDAAHNTTRDGVNSYSWNAKGEVKPASGINYLSAGDG